MKKYIIILLLLLIAVPGWSDTHYMPSGCANLAACFSAMASGDTLEIASGTYTGSTNIVNFAQQPPSGPGTGTGDARFTIVKAATPDGVVIGNNTTQVVNILANSYGNGKQHTYIKFDGIIFKGSDAAYLLGDDVCPGSSAVPANNAFYWYFKGCGFNDSNGSEGGSLEFHYLSDLLFEDCFTWGRCRYGILASASDRIVVRRHVDRRDSVQITSSVPSSNYMNYCSWNVEWQNVIAIDTDADLWGSTANPYGAFYVRNPYDGCGNRVSTNTKNRGSIAVVYDASKTPNMSTYVQATTTGTEFINTIMSQTSNGFIVNGATSDTIYDHCTVINASTARSYNYAYGNLTGSGNYMDVTNSVCQGSGSLSIYGLSSTSTYNNAYGCSGSFAGGNTTTTNLVYNYIFKPESSFPSGSDGAKKGAKILYKYGVDGTFHGEAGYATYQSEIAANKLWPWGRVYSGDNSWEKKIWATMRAAYDPSDETRGFCQSSQSITNWVATGAGTITPANALYVDGAGGTSTASVDSYIYDDSGGDPTAPVVTITSPTSNATYSTSSSTINISGTATDAVGVTNVTWGNDRDGSGTCTGTTSWSQNSITLLPGVNVLTIRAYDAAGNSSTDTLTVTYIGTDTIPAQFTFTDIGNAARSTVYTSNTITVTGLDATATVSITGGTYSKNGGVYTSSAGTAFYGDTFAVRHTSSSSYATATNTVLTIGGVSDTYTTTTLVDPGDMVAPGCTITSPTSSSTYATAAGTINLAGTASDAVGVVSVSWANDRGGSGTATGTTSWSKTGITLYPGVNVLTITARDAANNAGVDILTVTYTPADSVAPVITITNPTSSATYETSSSTINLSGTASDAVGVVSVSWTNDRGGNGTCTGTTSWSQANIVLYSGANMLTITARDAANNAGTDILTVIYTPVVGGSPTTIKGVYLKGVRR